MMMNLTTVSGVFSQDSQKEALIYDVKETLSVNTVDYFNKA
jgi:hypothetical protein